ncbi:MAG: hypothetical protein GJ680_06700 [Alteromonadaceae bacterium]|nr:hypothetical protein [Alteromonadaceae bacterium]
MPLPTVIAFSGASGSGKTTLINALRNTFDCEVIHFDDHVTKNTYPNDMRVWLQDGANANQIKTPDLVNAVLFAIHHTQKAFIFLEEPFGKNRNEISSFIDYSILLDTPLEICLSRVIKRHMTQNAESALEGINDYLARYDLLLRDCYQTTNEKARLNSDLVLTNSDNVATAVVHIKTWLEGLDKVR